MLHKHLAYIFILLCYNSSARTGMDAVLNSVSQKNKTLIANRQYWEAQRLQYRTGLNPPDPVVEYDYLMGRPENAGNETEFVVIQSFDFPTVYFKKSKLAAEQEKQSGFEYRIVRQDILFEAQKICIELVYRNKLQQQLTVRMKNVESIYGNFKTMLEKGEGNILDVNKASMQYIEIRKQFLDNATAINLLNDQLTALNGGEAIAYTDTVYPDSRILLSFEELEAEYEASDPLRMSLEQEMLISRRQLELSKALWLPRLEAGYHYQGDSDQSYNGIHTGITIPLWENRNTARLARARIQLAQVDLDHHKTEQYYEIKQLHESYRNLSGILNDYRETLVTANNDQLLNKALATGHISTLEYFLETNLFYSAFNNYLEVEKDYHLAVAGLLMYKL